MSKLFKLKEWLTLDEAAAHISSIVGETATVADLYRFALDGHLILSVDFVNHAYAKKGRLIKNEEVKYQEVTKDNSPLMFKVFNSLAEHFDKSEVEKKELFMMPVNASSEFNSSHWIAYEKGIKTIEGIWDLCMVGSETLDIKHFYQQLTSGLEITLTNIEGTFVQKEGVVCQLQTDFDDNEYQPYSLAQKKELTRRIENENLSNEEAKKLREEFEEGRKEYLSNRKPYRHENNYFPSGGLDEHDYVLVIRTNELTRFIQSLDDTKDKPITTQQKNAYLKTIYTLSQALIDGLTGRDRKDAERIIRALDEKGIKAPSDKTLAKYLGEAKELF